ncbi:MAG TPA: hypothetical protein VJ208_02355 [Candidatus Nanoarchaeia archaeon]|nr:hypothetical protein [Candidatus Nanoarchaeia archaeon]
MTKQTATYLFRNEMDSSPYFDTSNHPVFSPPKKVKISRLGDLVVFTGYVYPGGNYTVVPGIFNKDLGTNKDGIGEWEVRLIPREYERIRKRVSQVLKEKNYPEPIDFWSGVSD